MAGGYRGPVFDGQTTVKVNYMVFVRYLLHTLTNVRRRFVNCPYWLIRKIMEFNTSLNFNVLLYNCIMRTGTDRFDGEWGGRRVDTRRESINIEWKQLPMLRQRPAADTRVERARPTIIVLTDHSRAHFDGRQASKFVKWHTIRATRQGRVTGRRQKAQDSSTGDGRRKGETTTTTTATATAVVYGRRTRKRTGGRGTRKSSRPRSDCCTRDPGTEPITGWAGIRLRTVVGGSVQNIILY